MFHIIVVVNVVVLVATALILSLRLQVLICLNFVCGQLIGVSTLGHLCLIALGRVVVMLVLVDVLKRVVLARMRLGEHGNATAITPSL